MTLKELQSIIEKTEGKELPTAAKLRSGGSPVAAFCELGGGTKLTVYQSGFALYETESGSTVFRIDRCGGYTYFGRCEKTELSEDFFAESDWTVRLMMEGEDRLTHNRNVMCEKYESFYENSSDEFCGIRDTELSPQDALVQSDLLKEVFAMMTERQREVVTMYYLEGMGVKEIAAVYGISHQAVSVTLSDVRKKFRKNRKMFE